MSINSAPFPQKKLNTKFFEKNNPLLELVENHNRYIGLYTSSSKTAGEIQSIIDENLNSDNFYKDEDTKKVIQYCLTIQEQIEKTLNNIERAQKLGKLKDSLWENFLMNGVTKSLSTFGVCLGAAGLLGGALTLGLSASLGVPPIIFFAVGITLVIISLYKAYQDQKQAKADYMNLFAQPICEKQENPYSFFDRKKEQLESEVMSIEINKSK